MSPRTPRVQPRSRPRVSTTEEAIEREAVRDLRRALSRAEQAALHRFVQSMIVAPVQAAMQPRGTTADGPVFSRAEMIHRDAPAGTRVKLIEYTPRVQLEAGVLAPHDNPNPMCSDDVDKIESAAMRVRAAVAYATAYLDERRADAADESAPFHEAINSELIRTLLGVRHEIEALTHWARIRGPHDNGRPIDGAALLLPDLVVLLNRDSVDRGSGLPFPGFAFSRSAAEKIVDVAARSIDPGLSQTWAKSRAAKRRKA